MKLKEIVRQLIDITQLLNCKVQYYHEKEEREELEASEEDPYNSDFREIHNKLSDLRQKVLTELEE